MKKLKEFKDEEAVKLWGRLLVVISELSSDKNAVEAMQSGNKIKILASLTNDHPDKAMEMLKLFSEDEEYHCTATSLIKDIMELFNDEDLLAVFQSQGEE